MHQKDCFPGILNEKGTMTAGFKKLNKGKYVISGKTQCKTYH